MAVLLTGGAGFVAATLVERLLTSGENVVALDNLSRGTLSNLGGATRHSAFRFVRVDVSDLAALRNAVAEIARNQHFTEVWHLAANSDIPAGVRDPDIDLRDTFMTTFNVLKIMGELGIGHLFFASSSAIYGDLKDTLLTEETGPLLPISNYGAMKLASEAAITAAAERFLERALIFRFPNVVGVPATHGVIFDFIRRLQEDLANLQVLGDGNQQKSYLHVTELVDAMLFLRNKALGKVDVFNIGPGDEGITVRQIAEEVVSVVSPPASIHFERSGKGWLGDVPRFRYSIAKLQRLGWSPRLNSHAAIKRAVAEIAQQLSAMGVAEPI